MTTVEPSKLRSSGEIKSKTVGEMFAKSLKEFVNTVLTFFNHELDFSKWNEKFISIQGRKK